MKQQILIILLTVIFVNVVNGWYFNRKSTIVLEKAKISPNEQLVQANISIVGPNGEIALTVYFNMLVDMSPPIFVKFILKHFSNGVWVKSYLDYQFELCNFYKSTSSNFLFKSLYAYAGTFGVIPTRCPMKKGLYYIRNWVPTALHFPDVMPSNKFWFDVNVHKGAGSEAEKLINFSLYLSFKTNATV